MDENTYVLLLLDGEEPSKEFVDYFSKNAILVIATDGAAKYALHYDIPLDVIIGDMDSISDELKSIYIKKGTRIIVESEQHSNDFEKALRYIFSENLSKNVIVLGIHGKRTDHLLTNFSVMLRYNDHFESLLAFDATHRHHFLTKKKNNYSFDLPKETQISLTPLPAASGVVTSGLYYSIKSEHWIFGQIEGLSNRISEEDASVKISDGSMLISIPLGKK